MVITGWLRKIPKARQARSPNESPIDLVAGRIIPARKACSSLTGLTQLAQCDR
ncbi:hypothetical protein ACQFX9_09155 [Aliinostoc sp. HNIBRCY26]|uniref:hypothetical protein n=1 Tax=Aliinostoc sp. HNIBRCY26 TaxID=3418997 RepID=UPI003D088F3E